MKTDRITFAVVLFFTLTGLAIRISAPLATSFPLNDGGLFYRMILDLQEHHFALPIYTTYNNALLPFAYPPFAFYFYGAISRLGNIHILKLMQFLPSIISALTIPAFYLLAREMLDSKAQVLLALLAFTFVPRGFDWLIMGGGVTRSLGLLFTILAMRQAYCLFSNQSKYTIFPMIIVGSLVVYTHPEATIHTIISAIVFFLWKGRSIKGVLLAANVTLGVLLLTSPWWLTIVSRHGIDPFLAAISAAKQNSYDPLLGLLVLFRFNFTDEPNITLVAIFGLIGLFALLVKKKIFIPFWFLSMHTIEPRGGPLYMMIPMAMFAGVALEQIVLPGLRAMPPDGEVISKTDKWGEDWAYHLIKGRYVKFFLVFLFTYNSLFAYQVASNINQQSSLSKADLDAFTWVRYNTPADSQFALITQGLPLNDATSEWFPSLTKRANVAAVFGYEWVNDGNFGERLDSYQKLQECATQGITCLDQWAQETGQTLSYVYVKKAHGSKISQTSLSAYLINSPEYETIYSTSSILIFLKK